MSLQRRSERKSVPRLSPELLQWNLKSMLQIPEELKTSTESLCSFEKVQEASRQIQEFTK